MGKHVLVVDDQKDIGLILETRLTASGYEVTVAYDGAEALEKVTARKPDLIVLDMVMPKIDGAELSQMLSENPETREVPIIFLTALRTKEEEATGRKVGGHVVLAKPFQAEDLLSAVKGLIGA